MIRRRTPQGWEGVEPDRYKDEPGTWALVQRHHLFDGTGAQFETRCFSLGPKGHTTFESHRHVHCVLVLAGEGTVRLDDTWHRLSPGDLVIVDSERPHQFNNPTDGTFEILCIVDKVRDRPVPIGPSAGPGRQKE